MRFNKLVRDNIPKIISQNGDTSKTHTASEDEFKKMLKKKLKEEVQEFIDNPCEEELADMIEVIQTISSVFNINKEKTLRIKKEKAKLRGRFEKKIILEETKNKE